MPTLTPDQLAYIRAKSGDNCSPYVVSDALMQTYFDSEGGSLPCTIYSVLENRLAAVRVAASKMTDFGTLVASTEITHIKDLMAHWGDRCTSGAGSLGVGVWDLGIDYTEDDL